MGAVGVRRTITQLRKQGFRPIELERYCASNKIWTTKVKRLRLPDLLCVRTGLRVEVRAKSDLAIKMSDSPDNPDRRWDAGLRDDDLAAFIYSSSDALGKGAASDAIFFRIEDLRRSIDTSKLGPPKSASEGSERDRSWPATVPKRDGQVLEVTPTKVVTLLDATETHSARRQTYHLKSKTPYLSEGDRFRARASFLAGTPPSTAVLSAYAAKTFDPFLLLESSNDVDRYAAVKSFPYRHDSVESVLNVLEYLLSREPDDRIKLEAAGSAAYFGSALGKEMIQDYVWNKTTSDQFRMESVFILTELRESDFVHDTLLRIARDKQFAGNEVRQAAVWGLGKTGLRAYENLIPFIDDEEYEVALHAIVALGADVSERAIRDVVAKLGSDNPREAAAASEALRTIGTAEVVSLLLAALSDWGDDNSWVVATLGRLSPDLVRKLCTDHSLRSKLEPFFRLSETMNPFTSEQALTDFGFLRQQQL